jgi:hypothetical protein
MIRILKRGASEEEKFLFAAIKARLAAIEAIPDDIMRRGCRVRELSRSSTSGPRISPVGGEVRT